MDKKRVWCVSKWITQDAIKLLNDNNIEVDIRDFDDAPSKEKLIELLHKYDALIIGCKQHFSKDMIEDVTTNKVVVSLSVGMDHIDNDCFDNEYVRFVNSKESDVNSVAEFILGLMLSLLKRYKDLDYVVSNHNGNKGCLSGHTFELSNKTIGLIGAGNISHRLIELMQPFHPKIYCYTKNPENHSDLLEKVQFVELDELLEKSDIINISIPLTPDTERLLDRRRIELMKKNAILINTSREKIIAREALIEFVNANKDFRLALDIDVTSEMTELMQLADNINVIITPHMAGSSIEAREKMYIECAQEIIDML